MAKKISLKIRRYNPDTQKSHLEEFEIPEKKGMTVLDAVNHIKDTQDSTLAHRWSCRMGICGSCGTIINGKPALMCQTFCEGNKTPITVEPLRNFPVIKDLIVDTDNAMEHFRTAMPYTDIINRHASLDKEMIQTPKQRKKIEQSSQCIKCMLCYSACPVVGHNPNFIGPAASALAYRYLEDNHDEIPNERMDSLTQKNGVWQCSFIGECSVVCPKKVDPAIAIQRLKTMGVLHVTKALITKKRKK